MKLLLYCTKGKPYLIHESGDYDCNDMGCSYDDFCTVDRQYFYDEGLSLEEALNGKIVTECDYEVEEIYERVSLNDSWFNDFHHTKLMKNDELLKKSCLKVEEMNKYFDYPKNTLNKVGYAINIKNLHIFDKLQWLMDFFVKKRTNNVEVDDIVLNGVLYTPVRKAPQNMMIVYDRFGNKYVLISIHPEWLCKILNGEKTIEVRKKVLKEMI